MYSFSKHKSIFYYAIAMAILLFALRWLELRLVIINHAFEIYAASLAIIFTSLGIWLAIKLTKPKTERVIIEKKIHTREFIFNEEACASLNISKRELQVLGLMAEGMSNSEIADKLFVSQNTIKTHIGRLFEKLEASRRTQAVEKAKRLSLLP